MHRQAGLLSIALLTLLAVSGRAHGYPEHEKVEGAMNRISASIREIGDNLEKNRDTLNTMAVGYFFNSMNPVIQLLANIRDIVAIEAQLKDPDDKARVRRFTKSRLLVLAKQLASHVKKLSECALEIDPDDKLFLPGVEGIIKDLRGVVKHLEDSLRD